MYFLGVEKLCGNLRPFDVSCLSSPLAFAAQDHIVGTVSIVYLLMVRVDAFGT